MIVARLGIDVISYSKTLYERVDPITGKPSKEMVGAFSGIIKGEHKLRRARERAIWRKWEQANGIGTGDGEGDTAIDDFFLLNHPIQFPQTEDKGLHSRSSPIRWWLSLQQSSYPKRTCFTGMEDSEAIHRTRYQQTFYKTGYLDHNGCLCAGTASTPFSSLLIQKGQLISLTHERSTRLDTWISVATFLRALRQLPSAGKEDSHSGTA